MRYVMVLWMFLCVGCAVVADQPQPRRVLIVSIDGLRPDLLLQADCPNFRGLMRRGSYTMWAQTTPIGNTLPSHTSMLTGVKVETHGIHWNRAQRPDDVDYQYPKVPTLFELAKSQGYTTAMAVGKLKLRTLNKPDTIDWVAIPQVSVVPDEPVAVSAAEIILEHRPQVMFVHFATVDTVGHAQGWGSPQQLIAIENADAATGRVLDALSEAGLLEQTLIIVTADHGGFGKSHHGSDPRGLHIPWIAAGPGVIQANDLARERDLVVHTEDTFATACAHLNITPPEDIDGKRVRQAFD